MSKGFYWWLCVTTLCITLCWCVQFWPRTINATVKVSPGPCTEPAQKHPKGYLT